MYSFDWERDESGLPMLFDFYHAVVYFNVVYYQCSDFELVKKSIEKAMSNQQVQNIVEKFSIDLALHLKVYFLFATSFYYRYYIENQSPQDVMRRFLHLWHEGLSV